jgi:primase-polymerase (primpol)-like protein
MSPIEIPLVDETAIPDEMKELNHWVDWTYVEKKGELTKVPVFACSERPIDITDAANLSTFSTALAGANQRNYFGLGIALRDGIVGIDLDDCIDPITRTLRPWAARIVQSIWSYTEVSPSGNGVKIFARGEIPNNKKSGDLEIYGKDRFFTVTGLSLQNTPREVTSNPDNLAAIHLLITALGGKQKNLLQLWEGDSSLWEK